MLPEKETGMRTALLTLLPLLLSISSAFGACGLDIDALVGLITKGNHQQAADKVDLLSSSETCRCNDQNSPCFRIGPEGSATFSVSDVKNQLARVTEFETTKLKQCEKIPENNDDMRTIKLGCYKDGLMMIKAGQNTTAVDVIFSIVAEKLTRQYMAPLEQYFKEREGDNQEIAQGSLGRRKEIVVEKLAKDICSLYKEKDKLQQRLKNVGRHNKAADRDADKKKVKIEYQIKRTDEKIEAMKKEFEAVAGKSFFKYEKCKKQ